MAVDDDPRKLDEIERIFSRGIDDNIFYFTKETSFDEGARLIEKNRFDFVFLDVHEDKNDPDPSIEPAEEDQRGEEILQALQNSRFLPVIFYTGFPDKVRHLCSPLVQVVSKGSSVQEIRAAVQAILDMKLLHLFKYIEEQGRSYMWDSLSSTLDGHWGDIKPREISLLLARHISKSLSKEVIKQLLEMDHKIIDPLEMYLYPPEGDSCNPADVFRSKADSSLWMVLTPACDFEQSKADNVLLARIKSITEHPVYNEWMSAKDALEKIPENERTNEQKQGVKNLKGKVKSLVKNQAGIRYRYLPKAFFLPDCVVDFQELIHLPAEQSEYYEPVCSLDSPFREEMLSAFSKYYGRIGIPDYDSSVILERIEKEYFE